MKIIYCLPIIKTEKSDVFQMINEASDYDYYEIWLDYIKDLDESFIKKLIDEKKGKLIFLFRRQNLEKIQMDLQERFKILDIINNSEIFIDLDITTQKKELKYIQKNKLLIPSIISYHNYKETPDSEDIYIIWQSMLEYSPAIVKIATLCNNDNDADRLMNTLNQLKEKKLQSIVIGVGEFGKKTRIYGLLQGNAINFAPLSKNEFTAPGQYTLEELKSIADIMKGNL